LRHQAIVMWLAVATTKHAARAVTSALARGIGTRGLFRLDDEVERDAEPAAELPLAAGVGAKFVPLEQQRKARLGHLAAAELQAAHRVPLADRRPAVAAG